MKALLILLFVSTALAGLDFPGYRKAIKENRFENWKTSTPKLPDYIQDDIVEDPAIPRVRYCVSSQCEMRKCKRMVMELNYQIVPKMSWSCVLATGIMECMKYVEEGRADLMSVPGEKIYAAGKLHLNPILMEKLDTKVVRKYVARFSSFEINNFIKHYSVALVKKTSPIQTFNDLTNKKSCHYDISTPASFNNPICSLIYKKVIPVKGNVYESAADYFEKSCVPGAQTEDMVWNRNRTMPDSMCSLCKNRCEMKKGEPLHGYQGALKCLDDSLGHVGFFHSYDIMKDYDNLYQKYELVCGDKRRKLKWEHIIKKECHLNVEYPNVIVVHKTKPDEYITKCKQVLLKAVEQFDPLNSKRTNDFNLFKSDLYCQTTDEDVLYKTTNLIFNDHTRTLLPVTTGTTFQTFLDNDIIKMIDQCKSLRPKPRAFICVVGNVEKTKCLKIKEYFSQKTITDTVSWGCVEAQTRYECMELVKQGEADIVSLNATELFIAGREFNLSPFIGENYLNKETFTDSITVGVMRKDNRKSTEKLEDLKMCFRSDQTLSSYYHPIGYLMSNGTIPHPRHHTLTKFFLQGCWPGIEKFDFTKDYIGKQLLDFTEFLTDYKVDWKPYYQTPDWRKWDQKVEYKRYHQIKDFESERFDYVKTKLYLEKPEIHHMHTPKWHEAISKVKTTFDWNSYDFHDFYDFFPKFKYFLKVFEKPESMCEKEWSAFMVWVGPQWDTEVDCTEQNKWTVRDYALFKNWMDYEYADFIREMPVEMDKLHKDTFIRFYIYCNRFDWLVKQWKELQWTIPKYKNFRHQFCKTCTGPVGKECSIAPQYQMRSNHKDILHCVYSKGGELGFLDAYTLESTIIRHGYQRTDFVLLCPDGTKIDYTGPQSFKECNFGRVPTRSLVTCNSHDGVWRWAVTRAFLEAQKIFKGNFLNEWNFNMFQGDAIFSRDTIRLAPIELIEQTYQQYLGPMFLRSMEGLFYHNPPMNREGIKEVIEHKTVVDEVIPKDYVDPVDEVVHSIHPITHRNYMGPMEHKSMVPTGHKIMGSMGHDSVVPIGHTIKDKVMIRGHQMFPEVKDPRGEFYSTVIMSRSGTCNGISRDITCFGERKIVQRLVGRITKTYVSIPLCPQPAAFVNRYIEFTCDTGVGYMAPVMTATKCSYLPCTRGYWRPDYSLDDYWKGGNLYKGEKHWGTQVWWNPLHHVTNKNWFLKPKKVIKQQVKKVRWLGQKWRSE